ncbi:MAG: DUF4231 domain-containing protein [Anaerolineae bacterium]|nr:DUF4231 domain-containing protein [Anaerolineae bacterium]MDQ7036842.1 DUF4231 domain-containing protein [Anaerolineae bacterium]
MSQSKASVPTTTTAKANPKDAALLATWRRFLDYDHVSSEKKREYSRLREIVIALGLLTSAGAVFSIYLQSVADVAWLNFVRLDDLIEVLVEVLRVLLIIMPIATVALLTYGAQFVSSTSWIEYRVGAETLRSEIYLYRMRGGEYKDLDAAEARLRLLDVIDAANSRIDEQGATVPYMRNYEGIEQLIAQKTESPGEDDGFGTLEVENYIDWRVKKQLRWYIQKIRRDYSTSQREKRLALTVGAFGAVLSGLGRNLEAMVAVTTAMGIALTARSETRMYGATYGIFHWTAGKLQHELNKWEVLTEEDKQDTNKQLEFVEAIEKIFKQEREMWRAQAMQSQNNSDNSINQQLQQRIDRNNLEAHQEAGLIPVGLPDDDVIDDYVSYSTTQSMRVPPEIEALREKNGTVSTTATSETTDEATVDLEASDNEAVVQDTPDEAVANTDNGVIASDDAALLQAESETDDSSDDAAG